MKCSLQDDELQRLRDELRLRIDTAAKSFAQVLQVVTDLLLKIAVRENAVEPREAKVEASPVPQMMTCEQAAEYLDVKPQTLALWRSTGRYSLPFVKVGSKVRYRKTDLDEFLHRHTENRGSGHKVR